MNPTERIAPPDGASLVYSQETGELFAALSAAQAELKNVHKDNTAKIPTKSGGSFTYTYADLAVVLDACRPVLSRHDIAICQIPVGGRESFGVWTRLSHKSGQFIQGRLDLSLGKMDAQDVGSAITYLRRYALTSMVGVASTDDDDDAAAATAKAKQDRLEAAKRATQGKARPASELPQDEAKPADEPALTEADHKWIAEAKDEIAKAKTLDGLLQLGSAWARRPAHVKRRVASEFNARKKELEASHPNSTAPAEPQEATA